MSLTMKWLFIVFASWLTSACVANRAPVIDGQAAVMDSIARDYVRMTLEIGEHDEGYVDAYYGPAEWREAAQANPPDLAELSQTADSLHERLRQMDVAGLDEIERRRRDSLSRQVIAARTRLRMLSGERLSFAEEAQGLYSITPQLRPLEDYDSVLSRIETLVPGSGSLAERVEAFQNRFIIPPERLEPVMRAAIDECRRRTVEHIRLPADERFTLEFVTDKSWSGYNWYRGNHDSLIQINTDLPIRISRAVDLGCHEGYPGHHALNVLLEDKLARGRGWVEYMVYPLYSPQSFIAEGSANYGIVLAFPGNERLEFETRTLYPLAGLSSERAQEFLALEGALKELEGARFTIARDYLEQHIDRDEAIARLQRYQLVSPARAEQSLAFFDQYRSYVINYGLGRDLVRAHIEAQGAGPEQRWAAMERILTEPTHPGLLVGSQ